MASRAERNNNPGNLEYGDFAKAAGATGTDGRFAIFPDADTGAKAMERLLFYGKNYKDLPLSSAIARYAPAAEKGNNTSAYQNTVLKAVGADKKMGEYTPEERMAILASMQRVEGGAGTTPRLPTQMAQVAAPAPVSSPMVQGAINQTQVPMPAPNAAPATPMLDPYGDQTAFLTAAGAAPPAVDEPQVAPYGREELAAALGTAYAPRAAPTPQSEVPALLKPKPQGMGAMGTLENVDILSKMMDRGDPEDMMAILRAFKRG